MTKVYAKTNHFDLLIKGQGHSDIILLLDTWSCIFVFQSNDFYSCIFRASKMSNCLMVAAIDFGTTYSGYAFSTISNFKLDPLKIHVNQAWNAWGRQRLSLKTPTCLLLDGRKEIVSFGYEAENDYAELVLENKHHDHYYLSRFKMRLYNNKVKFYHFLSNKCSLKKKSYIIYKHVLKFYTIV